MPASAPVGRLDDADATVGEERAWLGFPVAPVDGVEADIERAVHGGGDGTLSPRPDFRVTGRNQVCDVDLLEGLATVEGNEHADVHESGRPGETTRLGEQWDLSYGDHFAVGAPRWRNTRARIAQVGARKHHDVVRIRRVDSHMRRTEAASGVLRHVDVRDLAREWYGLVVRGRSGVRRGRLDGTGIGLPVGCVRKVTPRFHVGHGARGWRAHPGRAGRFAIHRDRWSRLVGLGRGRRGRGNRRGGHSLLGCGHTRRRDHHVARVARNQRAEAREDHRGRHLPVHLDPPAPGRSWPPVR